MLFDKICNNLLSDDVDLERIKRALYPELPTKLRFWKAQFLTRRIKKRHNQNCYDMFNACMEKFHAYSNLSFEHGFIDDGGILNKEGQHFLSMKLATEMAMRDIIECVIRNPFEWVSWRWRHNYAKNSEKRIGRLVRKTAKERL